jgi:hypothetical protein
VGAAVCRLAAAGENAQSRKNSIMAQISCIFTVEKHFLRIRNGSARDTIHGRFFMRISHHARLVCHCKNLSSLFLCGRASREFISSSCVYSQFAYHFHAFCSAIMFSRNAHATVFRLERLRTKNNTIKAHFLRRGLFNVMHAQKAFTPPTRREASFVSPVYIHSQVFCIPILVCEHVAV